MRTTQLTLNVENFEKEKPLQFSIYSDANDVAVALQKMLKEMHKQMKIETSFEEFIDEIKTTEKKTIGVCDVYPLQKKHLSKT